MSNHKGLKISKGYRYSDDFKLERVKQIAIHGYAVAEVSTRLGIFSKPTKTRLEDTDLQADIARLKYELKRAEQERNILKEAAVFFAVESKNVMGS